MIKYTPPGVIVNATVSVVLGFVHAAKLPLEQEFQVTYVQVGSVLLISISTLVVIHKHFSTFH